MPVCSSCQRPVATPRPSCLYCGAPLSPELLAAALAAPLAAPPDRPSAAQPAPGASLAPARCLLVIDLAGRTGETLAGALGGSRYEAELLAKRGGLQLHRVLEPPAAEREAERLRTEGIAAFVVPEAELQARCVPVLRGERRGERLLLSGEDVSLELRPGELLLLVTGPIARQRQASLERRKVDTRLPVAGWRAHLHRIGDPRPVEIDPENFEPGFAVSGSTRLEIDAWLAELALSVPRDDGFRDQPPVLSPAEPEPRSRLSSLGALSASRRRPALDRGAAAGPGELEPVEPLLLDNLKQFRFYSAWHAAVERRRRAPGERRAP